jgi:hypothetical protein
MLSATPPASPHVGDLWWDSVGGQLYVYYDDGNSQQWVVANNTQAGVASFNSRQGAVTLTSADVRAASMGVIDGSNASAGQIGEFLTIATASAVSLPMSAAATVMSINLPAGDWDVWASLLITLSVGASYVLASLTTIAASVPNANTSGIGLNTSGIIGGWLTPAMQRFSLTATTTIYLNAQANFTTGTASVGAGASISARRVR